MTVDSAKYKLIYNNKSYLERTSRCIQVKKIGTGKSTNQEGFLLGNQWFIKYECLNQERNT